MIIRSTSFSALYCSIKMKIQRNCTARGGVFTIIAVFVDSRGNDATNLIEDNNIFHKSTSITKVTKKDTSWTRLNWFEVSFTLLS